MRNADAIALDAGARANELHIASFIVQHRSDAIAALQARIAASDGMDLVRQEGCRSIVLCECANQYDLLDRIEALGAVPGVLNVSLVYHHAEPRAALELPLDDPTAGAEP